MSSPRSTFGGAAALITGGAGGLGSAIAAALRERGARVGALDLSESEAAELTVRCDVTDPDQVQHAVGEVTERLGPVQMLICAAGVVSEHRLEQLEPAEWRRVVDASLTSAYLTIRAVAPSMADTGAGSIVTLSSGRSRGYLLGPHYAAAKAGVEALTRSVALELAPRGIRVNCVAPGPIRTPMLDRLGEFDEGRRSQTIPLGRIGEPADIVGPVLFLLGDDSRYMTGQVVHVNGGLHMP